MKNIIIGILAILTVVGFVKCTDAHDKAEQQAYTKYETCIQSQYGMSPSDYYQLNGTTPTCS